MADPDLLIFGRATTGLDLGGREIALRALSRVGAEQSDRAVVLVTHRLEEIPQGFDMWRSWAGSPAARPTLRRQCRRQRSGSGHHRVLG